MKTIVFAMLLLAGLGTDALVNPGNPSAPESPHPDTLRSHEAPPLFVWEQVSPPATTPGVSDLAVHPNDAFTAFLGTWDGLFKTADAGQSWVKLAPSTLSSANHVAISFSNPDRIFVVRGGLYENELYRSDNGGSTWTRMGRPSSLCDVFPAPSNSTRVYALSCIWDPGPPLFRSSDGGQTWITPTLSFTATLSHLVVSPTDPDVLIARDDSGGIHRSVDGGGTWTKVAVDTSHFGGYPVFDPLPPYTLYFGGGLELYRSSDAGQTWQSSGAMREPGVVMVSPWNSEVLWGSSTTAWRIETSDDRWSATTWNTPLPLQSMWRSVSDDRVLYALSTGGLWRYLTRTPSGSSVFLPLLEKSGSQNIYPAAAQEALTRANGYRAQVGSPLLQLHPAIVAAAQNHANYHLLNYGDASAWTNGPHGEVAGKPGFTGLSPSDRMVAAGFQWGGGGEVMHFISDPTISVDGWMATVYHRLPILTPMNRLTGYGNGKNSVTAVDVMDFAFGSPYQGIWLSASPYPLAYPVNGQTSVPYSWSGGESPNPLPPGVPRPVGYPFTLQGVNGALSVTQISMRDNNGQVVDTYNNSQGCGGCYYLISKSPLKPNTTYTVQAQGDVGGFAFSETWTFATGTTTLMPGRSPNRESPVPSFHFH